MDDNYSLGAGDNIIASLDSFSANGVDQGEALNNERRPESELDFEQITPLEAPAPTPSNPSSKLPRSSTRWGRAEDITLFKHLRTLQTQGILDLSEILYCKNGHQLKQKVFKDLCKTLNWKNTPYKMVERIRTIMDAPFSAREQKKIKTLVRKSQYKDLDYERILDFFPGKRIEVIERACDIICESRWDRNLNKLDINSSLNIS